MGNCNIVNRIYDSGKSVLVCKRCHNILESLFKTSSLAKEVKYYYWYPCRLNHRRKIETEEKAKVVVAAAWGAKSLHFFAALLTIFQQDDLKNRMNASLSSNHPGAKLLAWQWIESILSPKQQWRPLPSLLSLSFFFYDSNYKYIIQCRWPKFCRSCRLF